MNRKIGWLAIDDVVLDKTGSKIEGIAWLHSSSPGKKVLALNPVVMGWTDGTILIPLAFRFWKRPLYRYKNGKPSSVAFDGTPFKTKLQLAVDLLRWAHRCHFEPQAVLFDAYYLAAPVLKFLKRVKWHWVSRIKGNRRLKRGKETFHPKDWAALARSGKAPRLSRSVTAELPGWGMIRIIAVRHNPCEDYRFLVGSNPNWGRDTIERWYGHRWAIECLFRSGSQSLGLHDCQSRSFRAQENHVALVLLAHLFLARQARPSETAGKTIDRLKAHPAITPASYWPSGIRPVKREQRRKRKERDHANISPATA